MYRSWFAVALIILAVPVTATQARGPGASKLAAFDASPELAKVSSHLLAARRLAAWGASAQGILDREPGLRIEEAGVEVEIRLDALDPAGLEALRSAGLVTTDVSYRHARVVGFVPLDRLDEVAAVPDVAVVHPQYGAVAWAGAVDNQADASIRADLTRSTLGVDGTGVTVGVLSDSFHDVIGGTISGSGCSRVLTGSSSQGSGDLPVSVTVLDSGPGSLSDEGAAMAELIHDLAPGAALSFHTAFNGIADFADGIRELRDCGAHVIVDDVIYPAEPMFQDGLIAQAAQEVVDDGVAFFSSAGNNGTFGVDEDFADFSATDDTAFDPPSGNDFHDFGGGDRFATITIPPGCGVRAVLQWNDPFDSTLGPGASNDLDLYGCTSETVAGCVFSSTSSQGCSFGGGVQAGDPLEILVLTNPSGVSVQRHLAVEHFCGAQDQRFRIAIFGVGMGCSLASFGFQAGIFDQAQTYGHAAAAEANAVAAVFYGEIDTDGAVFAPAGQIDVEPFSSLGGDLPFFFDGSGNPLPGAPVTRFKPEMAAPDGTNTTFFGTDIGFDADAHPNFSGTSAAAPHAAAVAALMKSASQDLTPAGVRQVLQAAAVDIEAIGTDALSGAGLVDALDATQTVSTSGDGCIDVLALSGQTVTGTQAFRACQEVRAGSSFEVAATGDLVFKAGERVVLESGFSVLSGASFVAEIDPDLSD